MMRFFFHLLVPFLLVGACLSEDSEINWRTDFPKALDEARSTSRPLFVTFRCLPCKQCAAFDKDVLEGGPTLTPLLNKFVTVRLTDAAMLDERYFPFRTHQDLDLSWWGYFLSSEGGLYGVFGGKDHVSDSTRISEAALVNTMQRILFHHSENGQMAISPPPGGTFRGPKDLSAFSSHSEKRPHFAKQACLHCHQVADLLVTESLENGTFTKTQLQESWPLPENTGIYLDRDSGIVVSKIERGSPAEEAGIKAGDLMYSANGTRLFSQADFRGVLHRADSGAGEIKIIWMHGNQTIEGSLRVEEGWKSGQNWWRKSVYDGVYGPYLGFFPLHGKGQGKGSLSIKPFMGKNPRENPWWESGLRPGQEIVSINGRKDDWDTRQLLTWFRFNFEVGDDIQIVVKENGKEQTLTGKVPAPK